MTAGCRWQGHPKSEVQTQPVRYGLSILLPGCLAWPLCVVQQRHEHLLVGTSSTATAVQLQHHLLGCRLPHLWVVQQHHERLLIGMQHTCSQGGSLQPLGVPHLKVQVGLPRLMHLLLGKATLACSTSGWHHILQHTCRGSVSGDGEAAAKEAQNRGASRMPLLPSVQEMH